MINIADIVIEDKRWSDFGIQDLADRTFSIVFDVLNLSKKWEISILACNDAKIIELNSTFRDKPIATNVLSWPAHNLKSDFIGLDALIMEKLETQLLKVMGIADPY